MAMMAALQAAYRDQRATRRPRTPRTPVTVRLARAVGHLAGRALPRLAALRRTVFVTAGFGTLDYAAWQVSHIAGCAAIGVSLLLLDWLTGGDQ
jgi:hypothetical protein